MEARRTWSQAQQATQQLRKDRGFGKSGSSVSSGARCYICGGPHLQRDCPDRQHPSLRKGYGKSLTPAELDAYLAGKSKGKFNNKDKSKDGMFVGYDDDGSWYPELYPMVKGKGKNPKGKVQPTAIVYGMDLYPVEMFDPDDAVYFPFAPLELYAADDSQRSTRSVPPGYGMLDCGATASAGPEASAKRLIQELRKYDPDLQVNFSYEKRPSFRYGSGKWGQALYHACISSHRYRVAILRCMSSRTPLSITWLGSRMTCWFPSS